MLSYTDKKGLSEMISYVLIIVIAIGISVLVYNYLVSLTPKDKAECPSDISFYITNISCDLTDSPELNFTYKNTGLFTASGFFARLGPQTSEVRKTLNDNKPFLSPIAPGEEANQGTFLVGGYVPGNYTLELQPLVKVKKENILCERAISLKDIYCKKTPLVLDNGVLLRLDFDYQSLPSSSPFKIIPTNGSFETFINASGVSLDSNSPFRNGNAMAFDGKGGYVNVSDPSEALNFKEEKSFTYSFWVKGSKSEIQRNKKIFAKGDVDLNITYGIWIDEGYGVNIKLGNESDSIGNPNGQGFNALTEEGQDPIWNFILVSINRQTNNMSYYFNGNLKGVVSLSNISKGIYGEKNLHIGADESYTDQSADAFFTGSIDEFVIFNRSLNSTEVSNLYKQYNKLKR